MSTCLSAGLEGYVESVSAGAGQKYRDRDDEEKEVEDHISFQNFSGAPFYIEFNAGKDDEDQCR